MLEQIRSNKFLVSVGLGLLLMAIIYLEQEFINKNENNKFDLVTYVKAGFVGFTISFLSLYSVWMLRLRSVSSIRCCIASVI